MALHSISGVQSKAQVEAIIARAGITAEWTSSTITGTRDGQRVLAAIGSPRRWSVMVSAEIAAELSLPLWKDQR